MLENDLFIKVNQIIPSDEQAFTKAQIESIKDQIFRSNSKNKHIPLFLSDNETEVGYIRSIDYEDGQFLVFILFNDSWSSEKCREILETIPCGIVAVILRRSNILRVRRFVIMFKDIIVEKGKFFINQRR